MHLVDLRKPRCNGEAPCPLSHGLSNDSEAELAGANHMPSLPRPTGSSADAHWVAVARNPKKGIVMPPVARPARVAITRGELGGTRDTGGSE